MQELIQKTLAQLQADPKVWGVLLTGSYARGDATAGSDLDFWVLLRDVLERRFRAEQVDGVWVEIHFRNLSQARSRLSQEPIELYNHLDGRILHDPDGYLAQLQIQSRQMLEAYRTPETEAQAIAYWLSSTKRKLEAAFTTHDIVKIAYLSSTNAWKILEGLWAANHKPMPPSGSVGAHLGRLELPISPSELSQNLFAETPEVRGQTALRLIDWVLERLG
jgi:hypothetical protein